MDYFGPWRSILKRLGVFGIVKGGLCCTMERYGKGCGEFGAVWSDSFKYLVDL